MKNVNGKVLCEQSVKMKIQNTTKNTCVRTTQNKNKEEKLRLIKEIAQSNYNWKKAKNEKSTSITILIGASNQKKVVK